MEPITKTLNQEEIKTVEQSFKYSCVLFYSDALRFKFDVTQFKADVLYKIKFIDLMPLYNEWYYRYDKVFLNLMKKEFHLIKAVGHEDTFILFLTNEELNYKRLCDLSSMKSYKYKANFTKAERSLIYQLKNKSFKGSVNSLWYIDQQILIEELEEALKNKEIALKVISKQYNFDKNVRLGDSLPPKYQEAINYCFTLKEEIQELESRLMHEVHKFNTYLDCNNGSDETLLSDYALNDSMF